MKNGDVFIPEAELLFKTALDYIDSEMFLEGMSILELLKSCHPEYGPPYCYLAWINLKYFKKYDTAELLFQRGLELSPTFPIPIICMPNI